jgi:hypothetical protein
LKPLIIIDHVEALIESGRSSDSKQNRDTFMQDFQTIIRWAEDLSKDEQLAHVVIAVRSRSHLDMIQKMVGGANFATYTIPSLSEDQIKDFVESNAREELQSGDLAQSFWRGVYEVMMMSPSVGQLQELVRSLNATNTGAALSERLETYQQSLVRVKQQQQREQQRP